MSERLCHTSCTVAASTATTAITATTATSTATAATTEHKKLEEVVQLSTTFAAADFSI